MPRDAFADRVLERVCAARPPLCLGIDPHLGLFPPCFRAGDMKPTAPETADAVQRFCLDALELAADRVAAVKLQSAFFEQLGAKGMAVLEEVIQDARARALPVILDAKRGDIGSSAKGYAAAYLEEGAPLQVDALTVNPWLGMESLEPFIEAAQRSGAGVFVLVKTSNAGGADFQDHGGNDREHGDQVRDHGDRIQHPGGNDDEHGGEPAWCKLARQLDKEAGRLAGSESGFSGLGAVVGVTQPEAARRARELMPNNLFLAPGYGAQGGTARDAVAGFRKGAGGMLEGGLVNASRSLLFPSEAEGAQKIEHWRNAVDKALDAATRELSDATAAADQQGRKAAPVPRPNGEALPRGGKTTREGVMPTGTPQPGRQSVGLSAKGR